MPPKRCAGTSEISQRQGQLGGASSASPNSRNRMTTPEGFEQEQTEITESFFSVPSFGPCLTLKAMHPLFQKASGLTETIIAAAIEVHRDKGPGLIEYKGFTREEPLRFDLLVEGCVLVEAKAVEKIIPIHKAQLLSYMKLMDVPLGLLINFHELKVADGISRLILPGANQ